MKQVDYSPYLENLSSRHLYDIALVNSLIFEVELQIFFVSGMNNPLFSLNYIIHTKIQLPQILIFIENISLYSKLCLVLFYIIMIYVSKIIYIPSLVYYQQTFFGIYYCCITDSNIILPKLWQYFGTCLFFYLYVLEPILNPLL